MVKLEAYSPCAGLLPVCHGEMILRDEDPAVITALMPFKGKRSALSAALHRACGFGFPGPGEAYVSAAGAILWSGRDQAFLLGPKPQDGLSDLALVSDQSDAWAVLHLSGTGSEAALARLVPVDLRERAFPEGRSLRSQLGHMNVSICRIGGGLRIMGFRSMAGTLVHEIEQAMAHVAVRARLG